MSECKTEAYLLFNGVTVATGSRIVAELPRVKSFNISLQGTGVLHAKVILKGSNINLPGAFVDLATITLDGSSLINESGLHDGPWAFYKFDLVEISGTNATLHAALGA